MAKLFSIGPLVKQLREAKEEEDFGRKTIENLFEAVKQLMIANESLTKMVENGNPPDSSQLLLKEIYDQTKDLKKMNKKQKKKINGLEISVEATKAIAKTVEELRMEISSNTDLCRKVEEVLKLEQHQLKSGIEEQELHALYLQQNLDAAVTTINDRLDYLPGPTFYCYSCDTVLECKKRNEDGVSVKCPHCRLCNIIGNLQKGNKWVLLNVRGFPKLENGWCKHFQQVPKSVEFGENYTCGICCMDGPTTDASAFVARKKTPAEEAELKAAKEAENYQEILNRISKLEEENKNYKLALEEQKQEYANKIKTLEEAIEENGRMEADRRTNFDEKFVSVENMMDLTFAQLKKEFDDKLAALRKEIVPEKHYKCFKCKIPLSKSLRPDGVSVFCHNCKIANIVAEPKEGNKWIYIEAPDMKYGWCQHYQQVSEKVMSEDRKCQFCETTGACIDAVQNMATLMTSQEVQEYEEKQKAHTPAGLHEKMANLESIVKGNTEIVKSKLTELDEKQTLLKEDMGAQNLKIEELKKTIDEKLKENESKSVVEDPLPTTADSVRQELGLEDVSDDELKPMIDEKKAVQKNVIVENCDSTKKTVVEHLINKKNEDTTNFKPERYVMRCASCSANLCISYRRDGVSVVCSNCRSINIVAELKDDHKWTLIFSQAQSGWCQHFQQIPRDTRFGSRITCQICMTSGIALDASLSVAKKVVHKKKKQELKGQQ